MVIQPRIYEVYWICVVAICTSIIYIGFKYYSGAKSVESLQFMIIDLIFKILVSSIIFIIPSCSETQIIKSAFFGKLLSITKLKKPQNKNTSRKNKLELIFAILLPLALSIQQGSSTNVENQLIIGLLCVDVMLKIVLYIFHLERFFIFTKCENKIDKPNILISNKSNKKNNSCKEIVEDKVQNEIQYSSSRIILGENIFLVDHSHGQRVDYLEQNSNVFNFEQNQPKRDSNNIFFTLLNYFSDGICVINKRKEMILYSKSILEMTNSSDRLESYIQLMKLRNCQDEILKYQNKAKYFDAAIKKCSKVDFGDDSPSPILMINHSRLDECRTVGDAINQIIYRFAEMSSEVLLKNQTPYNFDMYCTQNMVSISLDTLQKKDTINDKLYKVSIRPFPFQGELYIFVQVRDVTHQNEIKQLQILNENKSKMMEQVTHEFRTPLNCIILLIQDLMERSDTVTKSEYLEPVLISAQSLLSLIQDLLDLAQLKAGKFQLVYQEFDLLKLCNDLKTLLNPSLALKGNTLEIIQENLIPKTIVSDQNRIRQILINLIGNAAKFTQKGKISINIKIIQNIFIELSVKDTGIGISPDDQKKLFKAFGKLENGKEMNVQGVGLGLMISNVLAEKLSQDQSGQIQDLPETKGLKVFSSGQGQGTEFSFLIFIGNSPIKMGQCQSYSSYKSDTHQSFLFMAQTFKISEMFSEKKICNRLLTIRSDILQGKKYNLSEIEGGSIRLEGTESQIPSSRKKFAFIKTQTRFAQRNPDSESKISYPDSSRHIKIDSIEQCDCNEVLIVDDQPFNILSLKTLLRKYSMRIDSTTDPLEAIEKVRNFLCMHSNLDNFKLIFMDLEMPVLDGYETAKEILKIYPNSYIIACSGYEGEEHKNHCLKMGMKDLITKPISRDKLDALIQKVQEMFITSRQINQ